MFFSSWFKVRWEPRIIKSFHLNLVLFWSSDLAMPVSSLSCPVWLQSETSWNNINDPPQLSPWSTVSRVVMLRNYEVISVPLPPPPPLAVGWLDVGSPCVSSLFIRSAARWSLFFMLWSCDPKYHAIIILINVFSTEFCVNKRRWAHPPVHWAPHPTPSIIIIMIFQVSPLSHLTHRPTPLPDQPY